MSRSSSSHTRPAYSLTSSEWRSIKRFGVSWGVEQYNLNPKGLAEVCFMKGDAAYKSENNAEGNEFMNMVKDLIGKFPDVFTEKSEVIEVFVTIDELKAKVQATTNANAAKKAQIEGLSDVARCLLDGTDPNAKDQGGTLLHQAATYSKTPAVVQALLDAGADLNARDKNGFTPLHRAAMYSETPAVVQALLDAGADLNARDNGGFTPLHRAAVGSRIPAMVKILLDAGADLNARDKHGFTPLYWATQSCENPVIVEFLILNQQKDKPTIAEAEVRAKTKTNYTIKIQIAALALVLTLFFVLSIDPVLEYKKEFNNAVLQKEVMLSRHSARRKRLKLKKDDQGYYMEFPSGQRRYIDIHTPSPSDKHNMEVTYVREAGEKVLQHLVDLENVTDDPRLEKARKRLGKSLQLNYYSGIDPNYIKKFMEVKKAMKGVVEARRLVAQVRKDHQKEIRQLELNRVIQRFNIFRRQYARPSEENAFDNLVRIAQSSIDQNNGDFTSYLRRLKRKSFQVYWRCVRGCTPISSL